MDRTLFFVSMWKCNFPGSNKSFVLTADSSCVSQSSTIVLRMLLKIVRSVWLPLPLRTRIFEVEYLGHDKSFIVMPQLWHSAITPSWLSIFVLHEAQPLYWEHQVPTISSSMVRVLASLSSFGFLMSITSSISSMFSISHSLLIDKYFVLCTVVRWHSSIGNSCR